MSPYAIVGWGSFADRQWSPLSARVLGREQITRPGKVRQMALECTSEKELREATGAPGNVSGATPCAVADTREVENVFKTVN